MRYATPSQITEVEGYLPEIQVYQAIFGNLLKTLAGYIEAYEKVFADNYKSVYDQTTAGIEIRYVSSEGRDKEQWRGHLLAASPGRKKVNLWCLTVTMNQGLPPGKGEATNSFDKPYSIGIDYFFDWDYGKDSYVDDNDNYIIANSEEYFNKKIDGFDFILEQIRTCLPDQGELLSWIFRRSIMQFTNASTHSAKGDLSLKFEGL